MDLSDGLKAEIERMRAAPQRDTARIDETLAVLRDFWLKNPDWRLGQLVYNAARTAYGPQTTVLNAIWNIEEDKFIEAIKTMEEM